MKIHPRLKQTLTLGIARASKGARRAPYRRGIAPRANKTIIRRLEASFLAGNSIKSTIRVSDFNGYQEPARARAGSEKLMKRLSAANLILKKSRNKQTSAAPPLSGQGKNKFSPRGA